MKVTTFQNVQIKLEHAGVGHRIFATTIDLIIITSYIATLSLTLLSTSPGLFIVMVIPCCFYTLLFEYFMNGQTPGKKIMKIKAARTDGSNPSFSQYLLRWLFRLVDVFTLSGAIAILMISFSKSRKRLGDLVADTTVVKTNKETSLKDLKKKEYEIEENYEPQYPQVVQLSDKDYQTILTCFRSAQQHSNFQLMIELKSKVTALLNVSTEQKPYEFIPQILKDYQYYFNQERT
ncbi:MAG: RDD family protein [Cytophagales bacterium]|nr:RDD family protein [Cytophagales bacterium]